MAKEKPKSALAALLDKAKDFNALEGADVGVLSSSSQTNVEVKKASREKFNLESESLSVKSEELVLTYLDPNKCMPWQFSDRPNDEMGDIDALSQSIKNNGQQEPVLVRPTTGRNGVQYEIIFGNRRWRACKLANIKILAIVKQLSDQQAALYQKEENENREDLSDYSRARSYKAQIEAGIFKSELELSQFLGISPQSLNDILAYLRVPDAIIMAIPNYKNISRRLVVKLAVMAKKSENIDALITLGHKISARKITSTNIEHEVTKISQQEVRTASLQKHIVKDKQGNKLFQITPQHNGKVNISINASKGKPYNLTKLKKVIYEHLITVVDS